MKTSIFITIILSFSLLSFSQTSNTVNHKLYTTINPETSEITVIDSIAITGEYSGEFLLNSALTPFSHSKNIKLKKISDSAAGSDVGMDREEESEQRPLKLTKWKVKGSDKNFVIAYKGTINYELSSSKENYQRGFAQSPGIIKPIGIYLAGSTFWVPLFDDKLMTFALTTELPASWKTVTQGERTFENSTENKHIDTWVCNKAQEEIFLIAAEFNEYSHDMNNGTKAMAFLRTPDEGLANKYLEVTEQYNDMYESMLGDYPYSKFALVENFWETGYGMPSFTLLGEKIIRFPFILHSSYPHELLHNWWGNSVYVDFESGNWCEGITVFMADHLIKEQRGAAENYRRSTLQKFSSFVAEDNDFPLNAFHSRHDGASESIGYGKAMMMWQMLRRKLGDEIFLKGIKQFYDNNKYKVASYTDIRKAMEDISGLNLNAFFDQWVNRKGAPELAIKSVNTSMYAGKYRIKISIVQKQKTDAFSVDVPINVVSNEGLESFVFEMTEKEQEFQISLNSKPLKLAVDPQYDIFRILHPSEVPPALSKIWGSKQNIILLPSAASKKQQAVYKTFAEKWKATDNDNFMIVYDNNLKSIPSDKTVWILGFDNKYAQQLNKQLADYNSFISPDSVVFEKKKYNTDGNSFIFTVFDATNINKQQIFISVENEKAIPGLIRKLPHYGKYSYLGFEADEPVNMAKGQWPVLNSPLVKTFDENAEKLSLIKKRKALAELKPVFSEKRMMTHVNFLASEELKGRGLGTPELDKAAEYIAAEFKKAGLKPIDGDSYFQNFTHTFEDKGKMKLTNVIGIIPGTDPNFKDETVVLSAHYDHLGLGWPDVRKGNKGKIHFGADDNASGVAILTELARLSKTSRPKRTIVFIACTGEEAGLIGSRYFVAHKDDYFKGDIFANVNLDTDGSLFDKKLLILNGNTAKEWKFIFMGTDYTTGIKSEVITQKLDASDQMAFIEKEIPAVQLFTGATPNYHRPSDTADKIDGKGLVKVAVVAKEVITYLADRENPMPFTGEQASKNSGPSATEKTSRKVSTGTVPSFTYKGKGVKVGSVIENSAGDKAGLKKDDIILEFDGKAVNDLRQYSNLLKTKRPGDEVNLKVKRGDETKGLTLTLGAR
ncbi:MAG: M20/M25/M40 family metallo-hydrolase [Bacteroidota bacterium]|nr:M20/M25/M40 family metallo-hydrolase [Bacteroidota bacterium]